MKTIAVNFDFLSKENLKAYEQKHRKVLWGFAIFFLVMFILKLLTPYLTIGLNPTHSISKSYVLIHRHAIPVRNQIIVFRQPRQPIHPANTQFVKYLRGIPGDVVKVVGNQIWINDLPEALAIDLDPAGKPFAPLKFSGVLPPHKYLALGTAPDSFDSRYEAFGLVDEKEIVGSGILAY